jgi:hypothetical protein
MCRYIVYATADMAKGSLLSTKQAVGGFSSDTSVSGQQLL